MLFRPTLLLFAGLTSAPEPPVAEVMEPVPALDVALTPEQFCDGDAECLRQRWLLVDLDSLGIAGLYGHRWIGYDYEAVTRPVPYEEFEGESELSLAVRLLMSEVGADRMVMNTHSLYESIGILYTVDNRLDPVTANPAGFVGQRPFPGCGPGGGFATCANAKEYLGMRTWRAENPAARYRDALLEQAVDVAVVAWTLQQERLVPDFTYGATSYVHRCGGAAYGKATWYCDGTRKRGIRDYRGAEAHTGPILFRKPTPIEGRHRYSFEPAVSIHYERGVSPSLFTVWRPAESKDALAELDELGG